MERWLLRHGIPRLLCGMASAGGGARVLACVDWVGQGPLFYMAAQLPTDPLDDENAVWYDILGLHGGDSWLGRIIAELTARNIFILVLSPEAMNSKWVLLEIDTAWNESKRIIPLLYRPCDIRADLKTLQIISFLAPKTYEAAYQELLLTLGLSPAISKIKQEQVDPLPTDPSTSWLKQIETAFARQGWPDVIRKTDFLLKQFSSVASPVVYRMRGLAMLEEGNIPQAREALDTALALVSDRQHRLILLGDYTRLLIGQERWGELLQYTREVLRLVPDDPGWLTIQQEAQRKLQQIPPQPESRREKQLYQPGSYIASIEVRPSIARAKAFVLLRTLKDAGLTFCLAYSPDGQILAGGNFEKIKRWQAITHTSRSFRLGSVRGI